MLIKPREVPLFIHQLQALLRRTPPNHQKIPLIKENLAKSMAGFNGESAIDYPLSFLPEKRYLIFHDLRLYDKKHYFQIDTLLLSRYFILLLEVKNIAGHLFFDSMFHQLIRTIDGVKETFPDPIIQNDRHELQLKKWLAINKFSEIPVLSLVIISNPFTMIQASSENKKLPEQVIHRDYLPTKIFQFEEIYQDQVLSEKSLKNKTEIKESTYSAGHIYS